jgi:tetratricopeptide (TPR) repeat protein
LARTTPKARFPRPRRRSPPCPNEAAILDAAGRAQQAAGEYNQALATYGKLATLKPDLPLPYLRMAEVEVAAKNKEAALQSLHKALKVMPDSLDAQRGIIMLELDAGRVTEALAVARAVQKQRPKEQVGYVFEGDPACRQALLGRCRNGLPCRDSNRSLRRPR